MWGTMRETSATAVVTTLTKLTSVTSDQVKARRKFKSGMVIINCIRWWFVVRGSEDVLSKLESDWEQVQLQTKWKIEPLLKFAEENHNSLLEFESVSEPAETQDKAQPLQMISLKPMKQLMPIQNRKMKPDSNSNAKAFFSINPAYMHHTICWAKAQTCRSVLPKFDELACLCAAKKPTIVCLVETWLCPDILDSELAIRTIH